MNVNSVLFVGICKDSITNPTKYEMNPYRQAVAQVNNGYGSDTREQSKHIGIGLHELKLRW
jgi:hypothetical protein